MSVYLAAFLLAVTGVLGTPVICHGATSDLVASDDERASQKKVGDEEAIPVFGYELKNGTYPIEVDSSSSMFRITEAALTVADGEMSAVITLGGKGYLKLFMGTGEEAVSASEEAYAFFKENENGAYTYEIPVEALNMELECTGFSKRKEKWYDHQIFFEADTLPEGAKAEPETVELEDGEYTVEIGLSGGTGKAGVTSPAVLKVTGKEAVAVIEWSSSNYDYMRVYGETYLPVNAEGNSVFEIPVYVFDGPMRVTADTTAMSTPHEIEYELTFHKDSIAAVKKENRTAPAVAAGAVVFAGLFIWFIIKRKRHAAEQEE